MQRTPLRIAFAFASALALAGCDLDVPDLNNPGIDQLEDNPTPSAVSAASTGLLIGSRAGTAAANGYVSQLGILGRESYNFDAADPRFVGELLVGTLQQGSPFGGNFWVAPYANMRLSDIVLLATDKVVGFDDAQKSAIRGYARTIKALDLLRVVTTRDTIGAVIETNLPIGEVAPIVSRDEVYGEIASLLDQGADDLASGGEAFPFPLSNGFAGFDTPSTFIAFNRAIRARVAAYTQDYATVLAVLPETFLDDTVTTVEGLDIGVYHSFSTNSGDTTNGLTNPNIFAHPSIETDAQVNTAGEVDARFTRKIAEAAEPGGAQGLTSDLIFTAYRSPAAPVPITRNEELILLRAEARLRTDDTPGAQADLDLIRTVSGGLDPLVGVLTEEQLEDELLYNRRYSLLFEGGHRWIDARRFDRVEDLPLDMDGHRRNLRYPLPSAECDARPGEPACAITSD